MTVKTTNNIIEEMIERYFNRYPEALEEIIEELDSWNGYLGDDRYYYMDDINEIFYDSDPVEILNRAYFGYDENDKSSSFNPNREYFTFNGYGNLVSSDYKDYSGYNDRWLVEAIEENRSHLDSLDNYEELSALFDAYENTAEIEEIIEEQDITTEQAVNYYIDEIA